MVQSLDSNYNSENIINEFPGILGPIYNYKTRNWEIVYGAYCMNEGYFFSKAEYVSGSDVITVLNSVINSILERFYFHHGNGD